MSPRSRRPKPFAELVEDVAAHRGRTGSSWQAWPSPIGDKYWVDQQGSRWHMRGGLLTAKQARRLLRRPEVAVLHVYGVSLRQVTGPEREALTGQIEQFFAGTAPPMSDFAIAEFRDDQRRVLLVVQESC
jgi:hypothetical protein